MDLQPTTSVAGFNARRFASRGWMDETTSTWRADETMLSAELSRGSPLGIHPKSEEQGYSWLSQKARAGGGRR